MEVGKARYIEVSFFVCKDMMLVSGRRAGSQVTTLLTVGRRIPCIRSPWVQCLGYWHPGFYPINRDVSCCFLSDHFSLSTWGLSPLVDWISVAILTCLLPFE